MPVQNLGQWGTAWCRYQCSKPLEHFIGSDLWPRRADLGQFLFTLSLSLPAPPHHKILQRVFLQLGWCSCMELGWSILPHCWGGSTEVNFHFMSCVGNRRDGSAFTYGATGQIGQTDDTEEWGWRECIWRQKKVKTTEEASSCRRKREKYESIGNEMWGALVERRTMRRKNREAKKTDKRWSKLTICEKRGIKKKQQQQKTSIPEYFTSAHGVQMTFPAWIHGTCVNTQVP